MNRKLVTGLLITAFAVSLGVTSAVKEVQAAESKAVVTANALNVRCGAGTAYAPVTVVRQGDCLTVQGQQGNWVKVRLSNGQVGYVSKNYINQGQVKVTTTTIVRLGPGTNYSGIGYLYAGTVVNVLGEKGNWYIIRLSNGMYGYLSKQAAKPVTAVTPSPSDNNQCPNGQCPNSQCPSNQCPNGQCPNNGQCPANNNPGNTPSQPTQPTPQPQPNPPSQPSQPPAQPEPSTPVAGLTADEQKMVDLVNQERVKAGLKPFTVDMNLVKLARMKSQDMIDKNYFSHQSPTYGSPFEMMRNHGVSYRTAGENIAGNSSVNGAHTALMNSAGHRANILNPSFTKIGIGIVDGGRYGKMFTQMFIG